MIEMKNNDIEDGKLCYFCFDLSYWRLVSNLYLKIRFAVRFRMMIISMKDELSRSLAIFSWI